VKRKIIGWTGLILLAVWSWKLTLLMLALLACWFVPSVLIDWASDN
jgi:hypothetical protein